MSHRKENIFSVKNVSKYEIFLLRIFLYTQQIETFTGNFSWTFFFWRNG